MLPIHEALPELKAALAARNAAVLVAPPGSLWQSLLGMNFIGSLSGFDVRGDRMILRD